MSKRKEVDAWFAKADHPLETTMQRVRTILLAADRRMDECIKWQSPTFTFEGNLASMNPRSKAHVSLMFHTGAKIPGNHPKLEGGAGTARFMKIHDVAHANALAGDLKKVVRAWCDSRGTVGRRAKKAKKSAKKKVAKKSSTKKRTATKATRRKR